MSETSKTLREMLDEFETIIGWFEGENLDIEDATKKFEECSKLAEDIKVKLAESENKIEVIKKKFDDKESVS